MTVTREMIEELIRKLNEAENSRPNCTVEETIAAIDNVCAPDFQGKANSGVFHDREMERQGERWLFTSIPDYHRIIERSVIDPPFAAIEWTITGTPNDINTPIETKGCSILECDEEGKVKAGTVYFDTAQIPKPTG
jgi:hypothetical protein